MSLIQVFYFVNSGDMAALITMGLIGFLTSFFSKNMIVILCVALTLSTILKYGIKSNTLEGLTGADENTETETETETETDTETKTKTDKNADEDTDKKVKVEDKTDTAKMKEDNDIKEVRHAQEQIAESIKQLEPFLNTVEKYMNKHT